MRFGKTLKNSIYEPWKSSYIDYSKLKQLLREDVPEYEAQEWTEDDEGKFVEELVNVQLERINAFQVKKIKDLRDRTLALERRLKEVEEGSGSEAKSGGDEKHDEKQGWNGGLDGVLEELDSISKNISELEKYSRINFTGFLKAAKKHDRKRGSRYRVRPLLQVRLSALLFNSEDYSPLLYRYVSEIRRKPSYYTKLANVGCRLSAMYSFVRERRDDGSERKKSLTESTNGRNTYTSYKCTSLRMRIYPAFL